MPNSPVSSRDFSAWHPWEIRFLPNWFTRCSFPVSCIGCPAIKAIEAFESWWEQYDKGAGSELPELADSLGEADPPLRLAGESQLRMIKDCLRDYFGDYADELAIDEHSDEYFENDELFEGEPDEPSWLYWMAGSSYVLGFHKAIWLWNEASN